VPRSLYHACLNLNIDTKLTTISALYRSVITGSVTVLLNMPTSWLKRLKTVGLPVCYWSKGLLTESTSATESGKLFRILIILGMNEYLYNVTLKTLIRQQRCLVRGKLSNDWATIG